jgi:hypothetical protein
MTTTTGPGKGSEQIRTLVAKAMADLGIPPGTDMNKMQVRALVAKVVPALNDGLLAKLEARLQPKPRYTQEQLWATVQPLLDLEAHLCQVEKRMGLPERTPINKMGLSRAEQLRELRHRSTSRTNGVAKNGARPDMSWFLG